MAKKISYQEPQDFFPKSVRKKAKIGEYAEKPMTKKPSSAAKKTAKTKKKK